MEYIIGESTVNRKPVLQLKTIGDEHTDLSGKITFAQELTASRIDYSCKIKEHYYSTEDIEGKCYDYYIIEDVCISENLSDAAEQKYENDIDELLLVIGGSVNE